MAHIARTKKLSDLMAEIMPDIPPEAFGIKVSGITADSRQVKPGSLFVAVRGESSDGHDYIPEAVENGCVAIIAESFPENNPGVPVFKHPSTRSVSGHLAADVGCQ